MELSTRTPGSDRNLPSRQMRHPLSSTIEPWDMHVPSLFVCLARIYPPNPIRGPVVVVILDPQAAFPRFQVKLRSVLCLWLTVPCYSTLPISQVSTLESLTELRHLRRVYWYSVSVK